VKEPTDEFRKDLLELLAKHAAHVKLDTEWNVQRAEQFYRALPSRARRIVTEAACRDGYVSADALRDSEGSSLRGHSAPLKQALERGVRKGWWPAGVRAPIQPQGPGFGKVVGYRMPDDLVPIFHAAVQSVSEGDKA
jgi:hypothetical protein